MTSRDTILDYFFKKVFEDLPRGALVSRFRRSQLAEYFGSIIVQVVAREQAITQEILNRVVCCVLEFHLSSKKGNGDICLKGKYHDILFVVAKVSFDWELENSKTASCLLHSIYSCEETFERLTVGAVVGTKVSHVLSGWKSDYDDRNENLLAIQYFMDKSNDQRQLFGPDRRRFADVPMKSCGGLTAAAMALDICKEDTLLLLLRYGAEIDFPDKESFENRRGTPFDVVFWKMLDFRERYPEKRIPEDMANCLRLLLRAYSSAADSVILAHSPDDIVELAADESVEVPLCRLGFAPPELKHLARCAIRRRLRSAWALPYGIQRLPLPETLRHYLDLCSD